MNYAEQRTFLRRFRTGATLAVLTILLGAGTGVWMSRPGLGWHAGAVGCVLWAGVMYAVGYLPLYLRLSVEIRKRYVWSVRVRWIVLGLLALATLPALDSMEAAAVFAGGLGLELLSTAFARRHLKRSTDAGELGLLPGLLLACDLAVALLAAGAGRVPLFVASAATALAIVVFLATSDSERQVVGSLMSCCALISLAVMASAFQGVSLLLILLPFGVFAITFGLVRMADEQHEKNVERTVAELADFTLLPPEEATEMLATATGILARNWNDNTPVGPDAVAKWYEDNSAFYLFDLAQFHLAYKHIAFMCDVVSMGGGRVLDYGAGIGDLALEFARLGHDAVYLDVDGRTKAFARWKAERDWLPVTFASTINEVDGWFDTIVSLDVFEHLSDPLPVVDALVDRLSPGGRMIVTAYFGPTKAHPMHFDHDIDLARYLTEKGLVSVKSLTHRFFRSEFLGKSGVLVFERPH